MGYIFQYEGADEMTNVGTAPIVHPSKPVTPLAIAEAMVQEAKSHLNWRTECAARASEQLRWAGVEHERYHNADTLLAVRDADIANSQAWAAVHDALWRLERAKAHCDAEARRGMIARRVVEALQEEAA
jgi:hypothetical protein